jgi:hypothetical protein
MFHAKNPALFRRISTEKNIKTTVGKILLVLTALIVVIILSKYNGKIDINSFSYGKNIAAFYITGVAGILFVVFASLFITKQLYLVTVISSGTILLLAFHSYAFAPVIRILGMYGKEIGLLLGMAIATISIAVLIVPILLVQKYFPIIIGGRQAKDMASV